MKFIGLFLLLLSFYSYSAQIAYEKLADSIVIKKGIETETHFNTVEALEELKRIKTDLEFIYNERLTKEGQDLFATDIGGLGEVTVILEGAEPSSSFTITELVKRYPQIKKVLDKYSISKLEVIEYSFLDNRLVLFFDEGFNPYLVAKDLETIPGIKYANASILFGRVVEVLRLKEGDDFRDMVYMFRYGWGACPAGCTEKRTYIFALDSYNPQGFTVTFVGAYGSVASFPDSYIIK